MWHEAREVERRAGGQNNGKWTNIVIHLVKAYIYGPTIFRVSINNAILSYYKRYVQVDTQSAAVFVFLCASFGIVFFFVSNLSKRCQKPKNERANANKVEQRTNDSTNRNIFTWCSTCDYVFFALPILFSACFWRSIEIKRMQEKVRVVWPYFIFVFVQRKC